ISYVLMTHMHHDHSGGLTKLNENHQLVSTFPNAKIFGVFGIYSGITFLIV
ncbi:Metallo-beta-lactamase protein, partial [human gut metagenome]